MGIGELENRTSFEYIDTDATEGEILTAASKNPTDNPQGHNGEGFPSPLRRKTHRHDGEDHPSPSQMRTGRREGLPHLLELNGGERKGSTVDDQRIEHNLTTVGRN